MPAPENFSHKPIRTACAKGHQRIYQYHARHQRYLGERFLKDVFHQMCQPRRECVIGTGAMLRSGTAILKFFTMRIVSNLIVMTNGTRSKGSHMRVSLFSTARCLLSIIFAINVPYFTFFHISILFQAWCCGVNVSSNFISGRHSATSRGTVRKPSVTSGGAVVMR